MLTITCNLCAQRKKNKDKIVKILKKSFMVNNIKVDVTGQYKYLGVIFSPSGSFSNAKEELYKKEHKNFEAYIRS